MTFNNHVLTSPVGASNKKYVKKANLRPDVQVLIPRLMEKLCTQLTLRALGQIWMQKSVCEAVMEVYDQQ